MEEILVKLDTCYTRLQGLQIQPTTGNMQILLQTLYDLKDIYNKLKDGEKNVPDNG